MLQKFKGKSIGVDKWTKYTGIVYLWIFAGAPFIIYVSNMLVRFVKIFE